MRTKKGIVGSTKMTGTVSVSVDSHAFHPIYKKRFLKSKKFLADVNGLTVHTGDQVEITECRPISKNKYFKVTKVLRAVPQVGEVDDAKDAELAARREKSAPEVEGKVEEKKEEMNKEVKEDTNAVEETKDTEDSPETK